jgi:site-specific DNA recombinase
MQLQNISQTWITANYKDKQKLQQLVFPEGIYFNKEIGRVRISKINSLFAAIPIIARDTEENKNGDSLTNRHQSSQVPRTGIEPAHPCERQILSLLRLPIPPSGQLLVVNWVANIGASLCTCQNTS